MLKGEDHKTFPPIKKGYGGAKGFTLSRGETRKVSDPRFTLFVSPLSIIIDQSPRNVNDQGAYIIIMNSIAGARFPPLCQSERLILWRFGRLILMPVAFCHFI